MSLFLDNPKYQKLHKEHIDRIDELIKERKFDKNFNEKDIWLMNRHKGIGGSDVAAILGLSPYKSAFELWQDKTLRGEIGDHEETPLTHWGTLLEPVVRQEWSDLLLHLYGDRVENNVSMAHKELPFLRANFDGLVYKGDKIVKILEIKTALMNQETGEFTEDGVPILNWGTGNTYYVDENTSKTLYMITQDEQVPKNYYLQTMLYMMVAGVKEADIAVLIGHHDFRVFSVKYNQELADFIIEQCDKFWCENVLEDNPPPYNADEYGKLDGNPFKIPATPEILKSCYELKDVKDQLKILEKQEKNLTNTIKLYMKDNQFLINDKEVICTWKKSQNAKTQTISRTFKLKIKE